jgi:hypothetical protein
MILYIYYFYDTYITCIHYNIVYMVSTYVCNIMNMCVCLCVCVCVCVRARTTLDCVLKKV